jgi:hypothetical protein
MMHRRSVLRALVGAAATLPALLMATPAAAQQAATVEILPGQIGMLETEGTSFALWPDEDELADLAEPRLLDVHGVIGGSYKIFGSGGPELVRLPVRDVQLTHVNDGA